MVEINMDTFVKRLQPERYDLWLNRKDVAPHPEKPGPPVPANPPNTDRLPALYRPGLVTPALIHPPTQPTRPTTRVSYTGTDTPANPANPPNDPG